MSVVVEDQPETIVANLFDSRASPPPPISTQRRRASLLPSTKGRVKVAVRCRPPFEDELEENGEFYPVVNCPENEPTPRVELFLGGRSRRNFYFDYVFGPSAEQGHVYDNAAGAIVHGSLNGLNGAIFAYGQTGTGKTYTMGILDELQVASMGIVPRALSHVFGHIEGDQGCTWTVTVSFLQIYLENVQDLLSPPSNAVTESEDGKPLPYTGLVIRENPKQGFYVEGLQKYTVTNVEETVELINYGLRNRVMAPTLMNTTSSRSHTILTLEIEKVMKESALDGRDYNRTLKGKLLLVDLAGSERVRRTTSKGTRLDEAKSINQSLSALGNVVAALADPNAPHVPFRDSKLTKLAQDSLGGNANTTLIATIGPAIENNSETLSTLLFASRCMRLKLKPVKNEVVDYAQLVTHLQTQLAGAVQIHKEKEVAQQDHYEKIIHEMTSEIDKLRTKQAPQVNLDQHANSTQFSPGASNVHSMANFDGAGNVGKYDRDVVRMSYETLCDIATRSSVILTRCCEREVEASKRFEVEQSKRMSEEDSVQMEEKGMADNDTKPAAGDNTPHLNKLKRSEAFARVEQRYGISGLLAAKQGDGEGRFEGLGHRVLYHFVEEARSSPVLPTGELEEKFSYPEFEVVASDGTLVSMYEKLHQVVNGNFEALRIWVSRRDSQMEEAKEQIALQLVEHRQREEEVVNWSYVLKFLLAANSDLKEDVRTAKISLTQSFRKQIQDEVGEVRSADPREIRVVRRHLEQAAREHEGSTGEEPAVQKQQHVEITSDQNGPTSRPQGGATYREEELVLEDTGEGEDEEALGTDRHIAGGRIDGTDTSKHSKNARRLANLRAKAKAEREKHEAMQLERSRKMQETNKERKGKLQWVRRGSGADFLKKWKTQNYTNRREGSDAKARRGAHMIKRSLGLMRSFWCSTGEYLLYGDTTLMKAKKLRDEEDRMEKSDPKSPAVEQVRRRRQSKIVKETYSQLDEYMTIMLQEKNAINTGKSSHGPEDATKKMVVSTPKPAGESFSQLDQYLSERPSSAPVMQPLNAGTKIGGGGDEIHKEEKTELQIDDDEGALAPAASIDLSEVPEPTPVEPYKRKEMTVQSLSRVGGGGWLIRKRKDKGGAWDAMFLTFRDKQTVLAYMPLSLKGQVELSGARVTEDIPEGAMTRVERQTKPHSFAVIAPTLKGPLILSAYDQGMKEEWMHAIRHVIQVQRKLKRKSQLANRRKSVVESALADSVLLEGVMEKKSISASMFKNWKTRIFNLRLDTFTIDYFDVSLYDKIDPTDVYCAPSLTSAHQEAVNDNINPIWFLNKCKFTFRCFLGDLDGPEEAQKTIAELGTDSDTHRQTWVKALMSAHRVAVH